MKIVENHDKFLEHNAWPVFRNLNDIELIIELIHKNRLPFNNMIVIGPDGHKYQFYRNMPVFRNLENNMANFHKYSNYLTVPEWKGLPSLRKNAIEGFKGTWVESYPPPSKKVNRFEVSREYHSSGLIFLTEKLIED